MSHTVETLESWGLRPEVGKHALSRRGYMAGSDDERLDDLNNAIRDPDVRAIVTTRGGAGAYRLVDGVDYDAARLDPKPLVGFSDITYLHIPLWFRSGVAGIHGCLGGVQDDQVRRLLTNAEPVVLHRDTTAISSMIEVSGVATGTLIGGSLGSVAGLVGSDLRSLDGAILLLEHERAMGLGYVDRALSQLMRSGVLNGVRGIALGRFIGFDDYADRGWTLVDVLSDQLASLGVPVMGGLDLGHGPDPSAVPVGTPCRLDVNAETLTVEPCVV